MSKPLTPGSAYDRIRALELQWPQLKADVVAAARDKLDAKIAKIKACVTEEERETLERLLRAAAASTTTVGVAQRWASSSTATGPRAQ